MAESKPGPIRRFFRGIWSVLDFTRRAVFTVIALFLLLVFFAALSGGGIKPLAERTALVIAPDGAIVEQYSADPASRALARALGDEIKEVQLRDLLRAIDAAKDDKRIERLVLRTDGLTSVGLAQLRELGAALRAFREAGKEVIAYADGMDQKGYYLAAQADEVYLHPDGVVLLEGLGRYRLYYREALQDKLGVDVHLFRVGEYKSAAEPYILDGASEEAKEADLFWMGDLWQRYLADVAKARGLTPEELGAGIEQLPERLKAVGGDLGKLALQSKLVDALKSEDQVRALLIERGVEDEENHTFRQIDLDGYLAHLDRGVLPANGRPQLAVVVAQGAIMDGEQPPGTVGGVSTAQLLREAREDEDVKAVVLRVDSPGGGVFPSEQIRREVELIQAAGKPVVVSMGDVAASGGYWISMNADTIYADPSTITGSIGIFGLFMSVPDTLDKIGVHSDGVGTTRLAGAFDPTRPLDPMVGDLIQTVIDHGYAQFTGKVAAARETTPEKIDAVGRGRVWSGAQAFERGLVDELGGLGDAIARAAELAKLEDGKYHLRYVEKELSPFEQFIANLGSSAGAAALLRASGAGEWLLGTHAAGQVADDLQWLKKNLRGKPFGTVAHCFCTL